jgi:hypothetical protein
MDFKEQCRQVRRQILAVAGDVRQLFGPVLAMAEDPTIDEEPDYDEMVANIELAYRHLEDARMRLGKALQAAEGGYSRYDD